MTTPEFIKSIEKTYRDGVALIRIKNHDYAGMTDPWKNFRSAEIVGLSPDRAILVRVLDKIARVSNLLNSKAKVDEKVEDTILDCINYLAILKAYKENESKKKTKTRKV